MIKHMLQQLSLLSHEQIEIAERDAKLNSIPFISSIVKNKLLTSHEILTACASYFKLPVASLADYDATLLDDMFEPATLFQLHVLPFKREQHCLQLAMSDPTDQGAIAAIRFHTGLSIQPVLVDENELEDLLRKYCQPNVLGSQLKSALARMQIPVRQMQLDENKLLNDEPVIQFVNQLLDDAINKNASDIHIETYATTSRVRFRRDGLLHETATLPHHLATRMVTRLKIMAELDITEKRLPQDGRFQFQQNFDFRVSTCPSLHGENIVLRLLQAGAQQIALDALGMTTEQLTIFQHALQRPQGLILVSGPTGSGKTATLYSALQYLNQPDKNILTVEDPIEIAVNGITQVNINARIGLDFANVLRAFLRQDPDVMMVGEIRDASTAAIAVQAAQTGHLVLATLHANSAADCVKRLLALGIAPCQLAGSLILLAAQRLIRKRCQHCHDNIDCNECCQGYSGRTGIFEILPISSAVTQALLSNHSIAEIENQIRSESHDTLYDNGLRKVENGITNHAELIRVTGGA